MNRLEKLYSALSLRGISSFLVSSPSNIYYLTGFRGLAPWERECFLLIIGKTAHFVTDTRYAEQAQSLKNVTVHVTEAGQNYYQKIVSILASNGLQSRIAGQQSTVNRTGFEYRDLKYFEFEYLQRISPQTVLEPQDGMVEEFRMVKDSSEIALLRKAGEITDRIAVYLRKSDELLGKTEAEVSFLIETLARKYGGEGTSFIPIVATGVNTSLSHHRPDDTKITEGPLFIDFGVKYEGYTSDITRTYFIRRGGVTSPAKSVKFHDVYQKVFEAQQTAIEAIKPGMLGKEAYQIAYDVLKKYDLAQYFHHSLGHGVGIDIHENPRLSSLSMVQLQQDMIFTVEPGVYIPGELGIQIEDTVLLTTKGCQRITQAP